MALSGHPARKVREAWPGFSTAPPCAGEKESASCRFPCGPGGHASPPHRGPGEQRASCAHSSKSHIRSALLSFALLLQPPGGCAPSASRDGSPVCRAPCAAVRRGRQAAKRASTGGRCLFAGTRMCRRKARPRLTDFSPMDGRKAPSGVPLSWVTFSRASERK